MTDREFLRALKIAPCDLDSGPISETVEEQFFAQYDPASGRASMAIDDLQKLVAANKSMRVISERWCREAQQNDRLYRSARRAWYVALVALALTWVLIVRPWRWFGA